MQRPFARNSTSLGSTPVYVKGCYHGCRTDQKMSVASKSNRRVERFKRIFARQSVEKWGKDYIPAILATRTEGPSRSSLSQIFVPKMGRLMHLLSEPEELIVRVALYNPHVFDIHEQRMLDPRPRPHPLHMRLRQLGLNPPGFTGTVAVAERLGLFSKHPRIYAPDQRGETIEVAEPYVGDLLIFLDDGRRPPYCVNWTIKSSHADFIEQDSKGFKTASEKNAAQRKALMRHKIEEVYYQDAGIPTFQLCPSDFERQVLLNLRLCQRHHARSIDIDPACLESFLSDVRGVIGTSIPALKVINDYAGVAPRAHFITAFYQGVWTRNIRINLFRPILLDKKLNLEGLDILDEYSRLFSAGVEK
jgi:hypothetical protein